jgi:iron complex outermembrane recepter protein
MRPRRRTRPEHAGAAARGKTVGRRPHTTARPRAAAFALASAFAALGALDARGAEDEAPAPDSLKDLSLEQLMDLEVTSASRHPEKLSEAAAAIEVITGDDIRRSGATSLPEALRLANSLDVAQKNAHDWAISARGFNTALANKLLVMIDGRTVYTPLFSGVFWDIQNVLLEDVERIEVISGPGGTLWGANAVNGVINIITKSARDTVGTYAEAAAGSKLDGLGAARFGAAIAPDVYARVYGEAFERDGERTAAGDPAGDDWRQNRVGFRIDGGSARRDAFTLQGDYYDGDEGVTSVGTAKVSGGNLLGRWSRTFAENADMRLQVYFDHTHLEDPIAPLTLGGAPFVPAGILTDDLDTFDVDFQHRFPIGARNEVTWGLGFRHTHDDADAAPALAFLPPTLTQNLYSAFAQDEATLGDSVMLTLGSKIEHNDYTGIELEPSVRLLWKLAEDQSLWAAVSRAVRTPSRVDRDESVPAPQYILVLLEGSPGFDSESVVAHELGYRVQLGASLAFSATAFQNNYYHLRSTGITPATLVPFVFENNLEGDTHGLELAADWRVTEGWRLRAGYDPLWEDIHVKPGAFDLNDAHNETADPSERWSLRSSLDLPHQTQLDIALRGVGSRELNDGPTLGRIAGYTEMDVRLAWQAFEGCELSIAGQNLLHARHVEYGFPNGSEIEIGRSVYGKIAWHF